MAETEETHVVAEEEEAHEVPAPRRTRCVAILTPRYVADAHEPLIEMLVEIEETPDPKDCRENTDDEEDAITCAWVENTANHQAQCPVMRTSFRRSLSPRLPSPIDTTIYRWDDHLGPTPQDWQQNPFEDALATDPVLSGDRANGSHNQAVDNSTIFFGPSTTRTVPQMTQAGDSAAKLVGARHTAGARITLGGWCHRTASGICNTTETSLGEMI